MSGVNREIRKTKKVVRRRLNLCRTIFSIVFLSVCLTSLCLVSYRYIATNSNVESVLDSIKESTISEKIVAMNSSMNKVYLAIGGTKQITMDLLRIGNSDETLSWTSKDEGIASVSEDGLITGVSVGETKIEVSTSNNVSLIIDVLVTDLITVPTIGTSSTKRKPFLPCGRYTEEEAALLDEILMSRINEAGYGTRGAAVAVARFLLLEFPYEIKYFNENGRMNGRPGSLKIDGEGRYYHKGLYLSTSKYDDIIVSTKSGPAMWGCNLYDNMLQGYRPNGLDCSGFVSWALYNAGLDVGDVGAGDYTDLDNELSDLGPHQKITYEFMASNNYKVGDFIARDSHAALIIGLTEDKLYTAESLLPGLEVFIYDRYKGIVEGDDLTYIVNMDDIYPNGEGIYTDFWTSTSTIN